QLIRLTYYFFFQAEDGIRDGHVTGVQTCALPISARGVTVENRTADRGAILVDRGRIGQALQNVIQNAVQHSADGNRVVIHSDLFESGGERWLVWSVEDGGPGFSPEAIASAFEPFYTTRADGTG